MNFLPIIEVGVFQQKLTYYSYMLKEEMLKEEKEFHEAMDEIEKFIEKMKTILENGKLNSLIKRLKEEGDNL